MKEGEHEFIESRDEMEAFLHEEVVGCLGLCMDGKPYVVPLNYSYRDGRILFHGALEGKKLDCIRANPNVCFTVATQSGELRQHVVGCTCEVDSDSVVCTGTARIIDDLDERASALNAFNRWFQPDADDIPMEQAMNCGVVEITVSEMTGRREREGERTLWRYTF